MSSTDSFYDAQFAEVKAAIDRDDPDAAARIVVHAAMEGTGDLNSGMAALAAAGRRANPNPTH